MGAAASSSSSAAISSKKYDVFISFRGEDTRTNFTSHLHTALCQKSIRTYIDYELPKGNEISQSLVQAIQDSNVSVVVFSENYASSKWCLDELTQILRCRTDQGQVVIPVFYRVDPSDVRKQKGTYKEAFAKHERDFYHNQHKVHSWKHALFETSNLAGWDSRAYRDESEFIQNIVNDILQKLDFKYPGALKGLVGIDKDCERIELLLEKVPIVGIWGMGGVGKTTMAQVVFAKLSPQYESCCFLENIREESEKHGLSYVRDKLVSELLKKENIYHNSVLGSTFVMRRLRSRKVFIVLDDVNSLMQLEHIARECDCLSADSRVIITTRDKHLLLGRVNEIHEAKALNYQESLKLFSNKAFHKDHAEIGYEQLSKRAVFYCKGIPLALIVLGSFFYSKTKEEWDSAMRKLQNTFNEDIHKVLKLSYDGLDYDEKEIFLDIACFLRGEYKEHVIRLLESCGFNASIGIRALQDKALITTNKRVWMHDLIQEMGWEIVRQECIKEPGRRSRLWDFKEVYDVLKNNRVTDAVEGIILNVSQIRNLQLTGDTFKKMINLRFLKFYSLDYTGSCNVDLRTSIESISHKIRYFEWNGYPKKSLPSTFCVENLIELRMPNSRVQKLWEGVQDFVNLRGIDLMNSKRLMELPDLSKAQNLERVNLSFCGSLNYIHPSILSLHSLVFLDLSVCTSLKSIQSNTHLTSLRRIGLTDCYNLKEFSLSSEELRDLVLSSTGIEILHPSIGRMNKLTSLSLNGSRLKNLPIEELCCLRSLELLRIEDQIFEKPKLHILFDALRSLRTLSVANCWNLMELPNNIKHLSRLQTLSLRGCRNLRCLPELPLSVEKIDVENCTLSINCSSPKESSVSSKEIGTLDLALQSSIGHLPKLRSLILDASSIKNVSADELCCWRSLVQLRLFKCGQIMDKLKLQVLFEASRSLQELTLEECSTLTELPDNIRHLSRLEYLSLRGCRRLRFLPELSPSITHLITDNCTSLGRISPLTISRLLHKNGHKILSLENCLNLDEHSLCAITEDSELSLKRAIHDRKCFTVCYPGSSVPVWFRSNRTTKASVTIELSSPFDDLLGFVFCAILPLFPSKLKHQRHLACHCYFEDGEVIKYLNKKTNSAELNSDHVLLRNIPNFCENELKRFKGRRGNDRGTTYSQKVLFKFKFRECKYFIKKCGVCPIYASEYHKFVQQRKMKSKLKLCRKRKRRRDIDELELESLTPPPCKKLKLEFCTQAKRPGDSDELVALLMRMNIS